MHVHFSALHILGAFLGIIMVGTVWRLLSMYATASDRPFVSRVGRIMAFQY